MKSIKVVLSLSFVFFFFIVDAQTFNKVFYLKGTEVLKEAYEVSSLSMADTLIIARLRPESEYYFSVYDPKTLKEIIKFGKKGYGPNEFPSSTSYMGQYEVVDGDLMIWLLGLNTSKMYRVNISKTIASKQTVIEKIIKVRPESSFLSVYYIDSTKLIGRSGNSTPAMFRLQIYNPKADKVVKTIPLFPPIERKKDDMEFVFYRYNLLFVSGLTLKPDKTKLATAMEMFNRVDILNIDGDVIASFVDKYNNISDANIDNYLSAKEQGLKYLNINSYYIKTCSSDSFIYTLYDNYQFKKSYFESHPVAIRIFDWESHPVCEIKIPDHLRTFTIDEKQGVIYGVDYLNEKFYMYDIKPVLNEIR